jgi:hypothetical protein
MDPTTEAGGVQPKPTDDRPWAGLGFRMEVATEPAAGGGEAGGEGAAGNDQADSSLGGLYDLGSVPEELRGYVEDVAKQIQGNVTRRFQEHADFRKTWEPFSQVEGLTDLPPDELQELVQFRDIASDPAQFDDWLVGIAEAMAEADPDRFQAVFGRWGSRRACSATTARKTVTRVGTASIRSRCARCSRRCWTSGLGRSSST